MCKNSFSPCMFRLFLIICMCPLTRRVSVFERFFNPGFTVYSLLRAGHTRKQRRQSDTVLRTINCHILLLNIVSKLHFDSVGKSFIYSNFSAFITSYCVALSDVKHLLRSQLCIYTLLQQLDWAD